MINWPRQNAGPRSYRTPSRARSPTSMRSAWGRWPNSWDSFWSCRFKPIKKRSPRSMGRWRQWLTRTWFLKTNFEIAVCLTKNKWKTKFAQQTSSPLSTLLFIIINKCCIQLNFAYYTLEINPLKNPFWNFYHYQKISLIILRDKKQWPK